MAVVLYGYDITFSVYADVYADALQCVTLNKCWLSHNSQLKKQKHFITVLLYFVPQAIYYFCFKRTKKIAYHNIIKHLFSINEYV